MNCLCCSSKQDAVVVILIFISQSGRTGINQVHYGLKSRFIPVSEAASQISLKHPRKGIFRGVFGWCMHQKVNKRCKSCTIEIPLWWGERESWKKKNVNFQNEKVEKYLISVPDYSGI